MVFPLSRCGGLGGGGRGGQGVRVLGGGALGVDVADPAAPPYLLLAFFTSATRRLSS